MPLVFSAFMAVLLLFWQEFGRLGTPIWTRHLFFSFPAFVPILKFV